MSNGNEEIRNRNEEMRLSMRNSCTWAKKLAH